MKPVSKRHFIKGEKVTVSIRLPEELKKKLEQIAKALGHGFSEFAQDGLDQWATLHLEELDKTSEGVRDKSKTSRS